MGILNDFDINTDKAEMIVLVGAGGKTTTMFALASELKAAGKRVLVTTTTAIFYPLENQYDDIVITKEYSPTTFLETYPSSIVVFGSEVNDQGKLLGVNKDYINIIHREGIFDFILVEGDGSKRRPIKAPASHEPVIPNLATIVVGVIGTDSFGKPINEDFVHRPEIFCTITNSSMNSIIDEEKVFKLVTHAEGLFKDTPSHSRKYLLLNKVIKKRDNKIIDIISRMVLSSDFKIEKVIIGIRKEVVDCV